MRILLLNPPTRPSISGCFRDPVTPRCIGVYSKAPYLWPPIGLAYIAALLKDKFKVDILDAQAEKLDKTITIEISKNYDLVIVNLATPTVEYELEVCREIKKVSNCKIVLIGVHATYYHKEIIKNEFIDFIIRGEPEFIALRLCEEISENKNFRKIKGLTWKRGNKIYTNRVANKIENLNRLPFPARELLPNKKYYDITSSGKRATNVLTSRGCPFGCEFCSANIYEGKRYRERSAENVYEELKILKKQGFKEVFFFDDTFTVNPLRIEKICELIKDLNISWRCLSRVDNINKKLLKNMHSSGCYQIHFGVESGSQRMLDKMNKGYKLDEIKKTFKDCDEIGIETVAFFILGFPGETRDSLKKTVEFSKELNPDFVTYNIFAPFPGSPIFDDFKHNGKWENYNLHSTSFCDMSSEEIRRVMKNAYKEYYLRFSYIKKRIKKVGLRKILFQNLKFWILRSGTFWDIIFG